MYIYTFTFMFDIFKFQTLNLYIEIQEDCFTFININFIILHL